MMMVPWPKKHELLWMLRNLRNCKNCDCLAFALPSETVGDNDDRNQIAEDDDDDIHH